jgi:SulP family sulfate permease
VRASSADAAGDHEHPSAGSRLRSIARLRRRTELGATFIRVINDYAQRLVRAGGRVYLSGLDPQVIQRLDTAGLLGGPVTAVEATPILGESTYQAFLDAEQWLVSTDRQG